MRRVEAIAQGLLHMHMLVCVGVGEEAARQRRLILAASRRMLTQSCNHRRWYDRIINRAPMPAFGGTVTRISEAEIQNT